MLTETVISRLDALGDISQQGKRINGLFRLMENPILWYEAYANIYANDGAPTKGVDDVTLDGFSEKRVMASIARLKDGSYCFQPVRRTYIPKKNGKKRPLGISSGDDKLVQEVVRNILERIFEPIFKTSSHGFRPGRSPHTALEQIGKQWTAVKWIVDMDLKSYFDTINHELLMGLLSKKIEDRRFLHLIQAMLDAGYLEDWTFHTTYRAVPQGSIVSPILANIFLHEFDTYMQVMKEKFDAGRERELNPVYRSRSNKIRRLRMKWKTLKGKGASKKELQETQREIEGVKRQRRKTPSGDPFEREYKRLYDCRYADDFIVGIIGSKADAEAAGEEMRAFLQETLKLTIAEEKSHIRSAKEGATFVGYWIKTYTGKRMVKVKRGSQCYTAETMAERLQLHIPPGKLQRFCTDKGYGNYDTAKGIQRPRFLSLSDAESIRAFNGELRGLANYYALACNVKGEMGKLAWTWQTSLFKTLANKHKGSISQITKRMKTEDGYVLTVKGNQKTRNIRVFRLKDLKPPNATSGSLDMLPNPFPFTLSRSELIRRLNADQCEYCGTQEGPFEVHHIRRMKDVARGKQLWQQVMAARNRKTLVLCLQCHHLLHAGKLPDVEYARKQVKGEPCTVKAVRTVRREGDG